MKLVFIRHAEPDYVHDTITEKGQKEAELLSNKITKLDVKEFYCSPLGRAQDTASYTLKKLGRTAITLDWLREFPARINDPDSGSDHVAWDLMPHYWTEHEDFYNRDKWFTQKIMTDAGADKLFKNVTDGIDKLLSEYGYDRHGNYYITKGGNTDTLVFFCHLGVQFAVLSHLLGIAAPLLWQGFFVAPTSVTVLCTEERRKGEVYFRCKKLGDTSHLYVAGEKPSDSGFFEETYNGPKGTGSR